jgi:hypothetical protein
MLAAEQSAKVAKEDQNRGALVEVITEAMRSTIGVVELELL